MKKIIHILFFAFFAQICFAQVAENVELTLHLKNGDKLTGVSELREVSFATDFGVLKIPIDQVNSIALGLQDSRFDKSNLLKLLDKVEYGKAGEREKAFDEVVAMEEGAIPFIRAYLNALNSEAISADISVQTLYEVMLAKHKTPRNFSLNDVLTYKDKFNVEGAYNFSSLQIDTDFGRLKIDRNSIARIDVKIVTAGIADRNSFKLFANQHISGNKDDGWLNTGILVKKGQTIDLNAAGQIMLASLSGNLYAPDGGINGSAGPQDNKLNYGQVVYKIGQNGDPLKAGDKFSGVAPQTGIIYIAIYESVFNSANSGYYSVNVKVK
jgi:hypothetical protein